jgi:hypothetical protein
VTKQPGPRHALVHFPLAGAGKHDLAAVRVIDWGQPGSYTRMTLAGPCAHELRKDDEIEGTIRTERLCGGCRSAVADGQLMVELVVADGAQICGASYTLALALADKLARGCLPRLADRTLIASGQVRHDGTIAVVGRLAEKLDALERALTQRPIAAPLLVLPRGNLDALTTDEQQLLQGLIAAGVRCEGVAALADMGSDWPPEPPAASRRDPPPPGWRVRRRTLDRTGAVGRPTTPPVLTATNVSGWPKPWPAAAVVTALIGSVLALYYLLAGPCASPSVDPAIIARCWGPLPVALLAKCRLEHGNGDRPARRCPSGTCLAADDEFSLEAKPTASGWLSVYYDDGAAEGLQDLRPQRRPWPVLGGQRLPLTLPERVNPPAVRPLEGRFVAVLTRAPLPSANGTTQLLLRELLSAVGEEFVLCGDPQ